MTAGQVTQALRDLYPDAGIRTTAASDGTYTVTLPGRHACYLGTSRDPGRAAAWISRSLPAPLEITATSQDSRGRVILTLAPGGTRRPDPASDHPAYPDAAGVLAGFPATRPVTGMVTAAIRAGLRPHIDPHPSPRGRRYRIILDGPGPGALFGCIDVYEESGRFAAAWLTWGNDARETVYTDQVRARAQINQAARTETAS